MNLIFPDKPVPFVRVTRGYFRLPLPPDSVLLALSLREGKESEKEKEKFSSFRTERGKTLHDGWLIEATIRVFSYLE